MKSVRNRRQAREAVCKAISILDQMARVGGQEGEWIQFIPQPYFLPYFLIPDQVVVLCFWGYRNKEHPKRKRLGKEEGRVVVCLLQFVNVTKKKKKGYCE